MLTLIIALTVTEPVIIEAPQPSAPLCIEFCTEKGK